MYTPYPEFSRCHIKGLLKILEDIERGYGTWFFKPKKGVWGRGVKEKDMNGSNLEVVKDGVVSSVTVASGNTHVEIMGQPSFGPSLPTQDTTLAGNAPGKSSYPNVTGKPSGTKVNFRTLFTPGGNGIDVVVGVESIRAISEQFVNTAYGFFLGKRVGYPIVANYGRSSYARAMIELRADVELKDNIVVVMPKITREGHYTCNIRVEYEWKPPRCASYKVFGHIHEDCLKNIGASVTKNLKKTNQAPKCIPVGPKMGFKPNKEYRPVPKKHTVNSSYNKKKGVDSTNKVSDSNPFEVLNSVDNDVEMGTNGGMSNLDNNGANSSGSLFWNVKNSSTSTTPIMDKIRKFENLIIDGQSVLVNEAGNPLKRTEFSTQSLLEQWRDSYGNGDYDKDQYDDDMYEGHDLSEKIQNICDKLDIRVRGLKKQ
ncbi:hypothetical protein Tco_1401138 [Tanacetum coccineum]